MHGSYTACRPEPGSPQKPAGPTHHSTPGLWDKPEKAETNRGSLRVDEDGRDAAPTTPSRVRASGLGVHFGGCDVQLSAHADTDAEVCLKSAQRPELHVSWRNQNKYQTRTDRRINARRTGRDADSAPFDQAHERTRLGALLHPSSQRI